MPVVLSIETSAEVCSVALHRGKALLGAIEIHVPQVHASVLAVIIKKLFQLIGVRAADLSAVAVSGGPGSYTGLRIGASTAKGLCFGLGVPLVSIGTLDILCHQARDKHPGLDLYCAMVDARRMEVYCMVQDKEGAVVIPAEARIIDEGSFTEFYEGQSICFFGSGAPKCKGVIRRLNAFFMEGIYPSATVLGEMATARGIDRASVDLDGFEPMYIKGFVAKPSRTSL
jgi:tRNA threonylcarbamoyladenosine biosynthesis protein TsaB